MCGGGSRELCDYMCVERECELGCTFQAIILYVVRKRICRNRVMSILDYIHTHWTPEWRVARMSTRES